jgi:hypothetical protein
MCRPSATLHAERYTHHRNENVDLDQIGTGIADMPPRSYSKGSFGGFGPAANKAPMSAIGPKPTCRDVRCESVIGG